MATFQFRLATLLKLREATRDERRTELAQALRADDLLQQRQVELARELNALQGDQRTQASGMTLDVDWLLDAQRYGLVLHLEQQQLATERSTIAQEIDKRRQALLEADREVRILEKLREVQRDRYRTAQDGLLMKQLDEVAGRLPRQNLEMPEEEPAWSE